ncbi:MAG: 3-methyl-2-oxobutanoate hydroxymethyltransferase [Pirellulaceae bacterium]|nr:3-methyl-2-oxobutanoate hydroxymethyltransferase [Pirellulaceae bacterium]
MNSSTSPVTVRTLQSMKRHGQKISMLTAYDFGMAQLLDQAGIDCILVGDSLGMVVHGNKTTVPVTIKQMIYHGEMVARAVKRAMVIVDLPFPVGQRGVLHTVKVAAKIMKKTLCQAVKMEGGHEQSESIAALVDAGIPTIAHIGLRPQSVHALGGYRVQRDADQLKRDALAAQSAGAFCVLMECVPHSLAKEVTDSLTIPTIGIGAGPGCDGQVLVVNDMLGMGETTPPKFVRGYANLHKEMRDAFVRYRDDITSGAFPGSAESFE